MKRALITGITGQDGRYLSQLLAGKGYEVFGMVKGQNKPKMTMMRPSKKEIRSTVVGGKKKEEVKSSGTSSQGDNSDVSPFPKRNLMN